MKGLRRGCSVGGMVLVNGWIVRFKLGRVGVRDYLNSDLFLNSSLLEKMDANHDLP